jgi:hypothetical protein
MSNGAPEPEPAGRAKPPPAKVAKAAADKQLGDLVISQRSSNPVVNLVTGIGCTVIAVALVYVIAWAAVKTQLRQLALFACCGFAGAGVLLAISVASLFMGSTATYLYANGIVGVRNLGVRAASWSEIDELLLWKSREGLLLRYEVVTVDGRRIPVLTSAKGGDKTLVQQLVRTVQELGRPVRDGGPYVRSERP